MDKILEYLEKARELKNLLQEYEDMKVQNSYEYWNYSFDSEYGVGLLNSDHYNMEEVIERFVKSNCKSWNEFCLYLIKKEIAKIKGNTKKNPRKKVKLQRKRRKAYENI